MSTRPNTRLVCWQGWQISLPRRWDPVKLEGDYSQGYALFADALRPRLGLRWQHSKALTGPPASSGSSRRTIAIQRAVQLALQQEVGQLAAAEAKPFAADENQISPLLYTEPQPPGRDVYSVYYQTSNRLLQVAYHAHRREQIFSRRILPTLEDLPADRAMPWSIFDLNCMIPCGMRLQSHRLNAGDLALTFTDRHGFFTVRQIAVASLALQRQPLDGWIADQQNTARRYHRSRGDRVNQKVHGFEARISHMIRRRRYALSWNLPKYLTTLALHDPHRDRLVILHGSDPSLMHEVAATVGNRL